MLYLSCPLMYPQCLKQCLTHSDPIKQGHLLLTPGQPPPSLLVSCMSFRRWSVHTHAQQSTQPVTEIQPPTTCFLSSSGPHTHSAGGRASGREVTGRVSADQPTAIRWGRKNQGCGIRRHGLDSSLQGCRARDLTDMSLRFRSFLGKGKTVARTTLGCSAETGQEYV